jgi:hypothetical protein
MAGAKETCAGAQRRSTLGRGRGGGAVAGALRVETAASVGEEHRGQEGAAEQHKGRRSPASGRRRQAWARKAATECSRERAGRMRKQSDAETAAVRRRMGAGTAERGPARESSGRGPARAAEDPGQWPERCRDGAAAEPSRGAPGMECAARGDAARRRHPHRPNKKEKRTGIREATAADKRGPYNKDPAASEV